MLTNHIIIQAYYNLSSLGKKYFNVPLSVLSLSLGLAYLALPSPVLAQNINNSLNYRFPPPFSRPLIPAGELEKILKGNYVVYVNGDNPLLLSFVRQVNPFASLKLYGDRIVIQAGIFPSKSAASYRQTQLRLKGIRASIARINKGNEFQDPLPALRNYIPPVAGNSPPNWQDYSTTYFILIRRGQYNLNQIAEKVRELGVPETNIYMSNTIRGNFVAIGPLETRSLAESWQRYLQNSGFLEAEISNRI